MPKHIESSETFAEQQEQVNTSQPRIRNYDPELGPYRQYVYGSLEQRFFAKVRKTDSCWIWEAHKDPKGYGYMASSTGKPPIKAHHASWIIHRGPIPEGMCVLHNCPSGDNPSCVNPEHLWLGTLVENNKDMVNKGRGTKPPTFRGTQCWNARLTWDQVEDIREARKAGVSVRVLMQKHGVSEIVIRKCAAFETYKAH